MIYNGKTAEGMNCPLGCARDFGSERIFAYHRGRATAPATRWRWATGVPTATLMNRNRVFAGIRHYRRRQLQLLMIQTWTEP